jgi:hypothetical protein
MKERAELGIDGNCGFALLGKDLQEGEAEFFEIDENMDELSGQLHAAKRAWMKLKTRLKDPDLSYYFGPSHPYGR